MGSQKKHTVGSIIKGTFANIGRVIAALIMVGIITGCIVASVLTVYVLRYINSDDQVSLDNLPLKYTTIIYADNPETGESVELQSLQTAENRTWVYFDQIPRHMVDALVAVEDQRFWQHHGVDYKRTFGAFVNMFIPIYETQAGGSTITQQVIKNITGDDDLRIERKVQEIFRALNLEKRYSKEQVLEAYLNTVYYANSCYGVQAAAETYFGKDVGELSVAESAAIIGITQFPGKYDPFVNPDQNKKRQEHILYVMFEQGYLSEAEFDAAVDERLVFQKDVAFAKKNIIYNDFVDHLIEEVIADLVEEKGYTYAYAQSMVFNSGLRIYSTVNTQMQDTLSAFYRDQANFPQTILNESYPQSSCAIIDPNGKLLAVAGGIGEKEYSRSLNRATQSLRQCGSSIKPISAYLQAIENDVVTWSTKIEDTPIKLDGRDWPVNHYGRYLGPITIDEAIQRSTNTIPVKLIEIITPRRAFSFMHDKLGMESLTERQVVGGTISTDVDIFPMALGGLTNGVTTLEMAGAYQIYANGGYFTEPYCYTRVMTAEGETLLEKDTTPRRVISPETATIVNKLMQRVTTGPYGTGAGSKFSTMPVAGKTGTTDDDKDQWFVGATPYYVAAVWMGFDQPERIRYTSYAPPLVFKSVMGPYHEGLEVQQFPVWGNVVERFYCTESGDLALETCPTTAVGWYKETFIPGECTVHADVTDSIDLDDLSPAERRKLLREQEKKEKESSSSSRSSRSSSSSAFRDRDADDDGITIIDNED